MDITSLLIFFGQEHLCIFPCIVSTGSITNGLGGTLQHVDIARTNLAYASLLLGSSSPCLLQQNFNAVSKQACGLRGVAGRLPGLSSGALPAVDPLSCWVPTGEVVTGENIHCYKATDLHLFR